MCSICTASRGPHHISPAWIAPEWFISWPYLHWLAHLSADPWLWWEQAQGQALVNHAANSAQAAEAAAGAATAAAAAAAAAGVMSRGRGRGRMGPMQNGGRGMMGPGGRRCTRLLLLSSQRHASHLQKCGHGVNGTHLAFAAHEGHLVHDALRLVSCWPPWGWTRPPVGARPEHAHLHPLHRC